MPRKYFYLIVAILIVGILAALAYFFFFMNRPGASTNSGEEGGSGFNPFGTGGQGGANGGNNGNNGSQNPGSASSTAFQWPKVREIWPTPVGGMVASTTASSTFVRFIDRGTGSIYDMDSNSAAPVKISNTTLPLVYDSFWSRNAMSAIVQYIKSGSDDVTDFYIELRSTALPPVARSSATSTATSTSQAASIGMTPFELRGKYFPGDIISAAVSPKGNQVFVIVRSNQRGIGYISNLDGSAFSQIWDSPLTQVRAYWPATSTVMVATDASAGSFGSLYSVNVKTGATSEVLGGLKGFTALANSTAQLVLYSFVDKSGSLQTSLYDARTGSTQDQPFATLPEKCAWSRIDASIVYCAVPSNAPQGNWPDDWYKGTASPIDRILQINAATGEVHTVSSLIQDAKTLIDAEWLTLDPKERFLYFVNKKDMSLWSVDLYQ